MVDAQLKEALGSNIEYEWNHSKIIEIKLNSPSDFLKIKETLSRVGVGNTKSKTLTQTCHILHRGGQYYIVHFKELFRLEGRDSVINLNDVARRNTIIKMLISWGLCDVFEKNMIANTVPISQIYVVPHAEKHLWTLVSKHRLGSKKNG
jgi:hypothetical protein